MDAWLITVLVSVTLGRLGVAVSGYRIPTISSLLSFAGCLIYFSRKDYVYLITNKVGRVLASIRPESAPGLVVETFRSAATGYYCYLLFRPFAGALIGPVLYMIVVSGLVTFGRESMIPEAGVSQAGKYLLFTLSFLGGHAASDIYDYFSWLAKASVAKRKGGGPPSSESGTIPRAAVNADFLLPWRKPWSVPRWSSSGALGFRFPVRRFPPIHHQIIPPASVAP